LAAKKRLKLAEPSGFDGRALERLAGFFDVDQGAVTRADLPAVFSEFDAFWFRLGHRIGPRELPRGARVKVIATPVTGLDHIDLEWCHAVGVRVVSLRGETAFLREVRATAEHTLALTLALYRAIPSATRDVGEGHWRRDHFQGREIHGKTVGVVGVGRLGTMVGALFRALGARVIGFDPAVTLPDGFETCESLDALLGSSDIVSLHVPYGDDTRHLIDKRALALMRADAVLINTSRGGVVDDRALVTALESGRLGGAALDVLDGEPDIDREHPAVAYARAHQNLLLTPHIGGNTVESFEKTERFLAERVIEALS
jgi:D-3-phosphoglycerate dehydrogenase